MCPHFHAHVRAASGAAMCAQRMSVSSECHQKSWHEDAKRLARGPAGLLLHVQLSHHWLATRLPADGFSGLGLRPRCTEGHTVTARAAANGTLQESCSLGKESQLEEIFHTFL